ncbi:23S rRNA pseudouridine synthase F [Niastella yeongjuensis]|uniref:Pseudouridine synthase n=1 Tax=Niastella yeongjuensis TaxID=354355 RepID=A0A1V9EUN3_9BACT|nr:23S rRNA pseudouridine(2604) synthase RluF [Niastella yeongjuensis]OQP49791.1 23S rRNA pseudouridine synthase F [Niastella yeongjuensis]SEP40292.1 23S rRNA pseudouridine2604 synthase [Niastella yeongjuensis]
MDNSISLNKFISDTGYCSRREADNLISTGRVMLNNRPAALGNRYKPGDTVEVDGSIITAAKKEKRVYLALNKPPGITTTTELHIKDNIISFVNYPKRIFPIGRLDKDSEGLILLTNDGDIINKILRADNNHEKEYIVRVNKPIDNAFIHQMSSGVPILDTRTLPCKVQPMGRQTFRITLTQGLNRQIRRMCEHLGYAVVGLQRVRVMNIRLDKLALGKWRYLSDAELSALMESISDSTKVQSPAKPAPRQRKGAENREQVDKSKAAKPATKATKPASKATKPPVKEGKPQTGKKEEKSWKREKPAKKSTQDRKGQHTRPGKNTGKEKKNHENKKERRQGAEGSFKNYRSKGRR